MQLELNERDFIGFFSNRSSRLYTQLAKSLLPFTDDESNAIANKPKLLKDLFAQIRTGSYFPQNPRGYIVTPKHNGVPRFIPVLTFKDNLVYTFCIHRLLSSEPLRRAANTYGGYSGGGKPRSAEEKELSQLDESIMDYTSPYPFANSFDPKRMRGIWKAYQRAAYTHSRQSQYGYFINLDIANFYDSINLDLLEKMLRSTISNRDLVVTDLMFILLGYWNRAIDGYGKKSVGLPIEEIGDNSRILANFFLASYDQAMSDYTKSKEYPLRYLRFADDQILMADSQSSAESLLFFAADELRKLGLSINSGKVVRFESLDEFDRYWCFEDFMLLDRNSSDYDMNQFAKNYFQLLSGIQSRDFNHPVRSQSLLNALIYRIDSPDLSKEYKDRLVMEVIQNGHLPSLDYSQIAKVRSVLSRDTADAFDLESQRLVDNARFNMFTLSLSRVYGSHPKPDWLARALEIQLSYWRSA